MRSPRSPNHQMSTSHRRSARAGSPAAKRDEASDPQASKRGARAVSTVHLKVGGHTIALPKSLAAYVTAKDEKTVGDIQAHPQTTEEARGEKAGDQEAVGGGLRHDLSASKSPRGERVHHAVLRPFAERLARPIGNVLKPRRPIPVTSRTWGDDSRRFSSTDAASPMGATNRPSVAIIGWNAEQTLEVQVGTQERPCPT